ncbi:hypothetical protein H7S74_13260 [Priestia aryabhattai]|uniref:hypothetical protein n=1 Tax=Priestia aryabhattai TaxID=412384 RepID=UPI001ED2FC97|nr:hypothetical protein [Priestia aryabhattai]MBY0091426.1 hypothetical protein [Priestia aryabhattai]MBY0102319.1 hypothetical protein [Priestia aryabhattai]
MSSKESRGRKNKLGTKEVREIITLFRKEKEPVGLIKPTDVYQFTIELYQENKISDLPSDAFWRKQDRLGRKEINKANQVVSKAVYISTGKKIKVPNITDLVNKKYKKKTELMDHLLDMEKDFTKTLEREEALKIQLAEIRDKNAQLEAQNKELQALVHRLWAITQDNPTKEVWERTEYAVNNLTKDTLGYLALGDTKKLERKSNKYINLLK